MQTIKILFFLRRFPAIFTVFMGLLALVPAEARNRGEPADPPTVLLHMVQAAQEAKLEYLQSHATPGEPNTYHLVSAEYLGSIQHNDELVHLGVLFFLRSSNPGSDTPPARGHTYLVMYSAQFEVLATSYDPESMIVRGNVLYRKADGQPVADFDSPSVMELHAGFHVGNQPLPYPFKDRNERFKALTGENLPDDAAQRSARGTD